MKKNKEKIIAVSDSGGFVVTESINHSLILCRDKKGGFEPLAKIKNRQFIAFGDDRGRSMMFGLTSTELADCNTVLSKIRNPI